MNIRKGNHCECCHKAMSSGNMYCESCFEYRDKALKAFSLLRVDWEKKHENWIENTMKQLMAADTMTQEYNKK